MRRSVRSPNRAVLSLQPLEGREVPAGNVFATISAGVLSLTGDNLSNAVTIRVSGNSVTISGNSGTLVDGLPSVSGIATVRAVAANMNGGDDVVRIDPSSNFVIPGQVSINLGEGNNTLTLQTAGQIALGSLSVAGGSGNDAISVMGGANRGSIITGSLVIGTGGGSDAVGLRNLSVSGATTIATGIGADTVGINASTFRGTFSADLGAGNDALRIAQLAGSVAPVNFQGTVSVNTQAGDDTLLLGRAVTAGGDANSRVLFHGGTINGAGGFNVFDTIRAQRTGSVFLLGWA